MDCLGKRFKKFKQGNSEPLPQSQVRPNGFSSRINYGDGQPSGCFPTKKISSTSNHMIVPQPLRQTKTIQNQQEKVIDKERKSYQNQQKKEGILGGLFHHHKDKQSSNSEENKDKKKGIFSGFGRKSQSSSQKDKNVKKSSESSSRKEEIKVAGGVMTEAVIAPARSKSSSSKSSKSSNSSKNKKTLTEKIKEHLPGSRSASGSKIKQKIEQKEQKTEHIFGQVVQKILPDEPKVFDYINDEFRDYDESNFKVKGISVPGVNIN